MAVNEDTKDMAVDGHSEATDSKEPKVDASVGSKDLTEPTVNVSMVLKQSGEPLGTPTDVIFKHPVSAADAPTYMHYPFVTGMYRTGGNHMDCWRSLFSLHTETVNIWSMIFISVLSIFATSFVSTMYLDANSIPIFVIFTLSAVLHLPFSVGFHMFMPINIKVFNLWRRLDVLAIFAVSVLLTFSLAFFAMPWWGCLMNTLAASIVALYAMFSFWRIPDDHELDSTKHALFVGCIILCYWFPMAYGLIRDAVGCQFTLSSATAVGVFISLVCAGYCFATAFPQRLAPGWFNVWGHSHQMMHVGVVIAHMLEFLFIWDNWKRFHR